MNSVVKQRIVFLSAILIFLLAKITIFFSITRNIWWDEAVYLQMAKYVVTFGSGGMWEILRPPILPILLSPFSLSSSAFTLAIILSNLVAVLVAVLVYILLKNTVDSWIAVLASIATLFFPLAFSWSGFVLTSYLAAAAILAAAITYKKNLPALTAILVSLSFLTRFPAGLAIAGFGLAYVYQYITDKKSIKELLIYTGVAVLILGIWMSGNWLAWNQQTATWWHAAIRPLLFGASTALFESQWLYSPSLWFYVIILFTQLPITFFIFALTKNEFEYLPLAITGTLLLIFFSIITNQQERFILLFSPIICVYAALGAHRIAQQKKRFKTVVYALFIVSIVFGAIMGISQELDRPPANQEYQEVISYLNNHPIPGTILVNDPRAALHVNNQVYPVYYESLSLFDNYLDKQPSAVVFVPGFFLCETQNCTLKPIVDRLTSEYVLAQTLIHWDRNYYFFFIDDRHGSISVNFLREEYNLTSS